ncbi:MAG: CopG family transcriptional regulator [Propionibacteriaceae bacterium]|nr:CopG family transcriptional regulator [Propionibacteriaceae bacterium]
MRTTVSVDDVLLERAKRRAARDGRTLGQYVEDVLRRDLAAMPPQPGGPVELPTVPGGQPRPGVALDSNRDLFEAMDWEDLAR